VCGLLLTPNADGSSECRPLGLPPWLTPLVKEEFAETLLVRAVVATEPSLRASSAPLLFLTSSSSVPLPPDAVGSSCGDWLPFDSASMWEVALPFLREGCERRD